jgi:ribosomal protein S3
MVRLFQTVLTPVASELVRFITYKVLFKALRTYLIAGLKRFFKHHPLASINTIFVCSSPTSANAEFIARYVAMRLRNRFPINRLINLVLSQMTRLLNSAQIVGFKIACSGRFERRGRASYVWEQCGKVAAGNLNLKVDYSLKLVTLTNSICGIKVWITKSKQSNKLFII